MILYFSGTGNSEYVAKRIAETVEDECLNIAGRLKSSDYSGFSSDRPWVLVAPTYAWQAPRIVRKWLIKTRLMGEKRIYFVLTCESQVGDAAGYLKAIAEHKKLTYMGLGKVEMPNNYFILSKVPDREKALDIIAASEEHINELAFKIKNGEAFDELKLRFGDKAKSKGVNKGFNSWFGKHPIDKKFSVLDSCIGCGKCERMCPTGNVVLGEDRNPAWHGNCIQCLSCISRCPENAIVYGKKQKEKYFCPKV